MVALMSLGQNGDFVAWGWGTKLDVINMLRLKQEHH